MNTTRKHTIRTREWEEKGENYGNKRFLSDFNGACKIRKD